MKIGIVTTWFERGAAYVSRQFMDVLKHTDEVFIYARGGEKLAKGNPIWDLPCVYWGKRLPLSAQYCYAGGTYIDRKDFEKWINKNKIELLLFNEQQWFLPVLWAKELGIKTAAYIDYYTEELIPLYDIYDCLICNTKRHAFAFREHKNIIYIKWGTNVDLYKPSTIENEKVTFFHSAGMAPQRKGTDLVLKAFYLMPSRRNSKLLLHTQVPILKHYPLLSKMINEMKNEGTIEIVEGTITAPGLYYKADVYVYPSRLDGIGLTLMEAISSGLACITSDNAPMNEFIEDDFGMLTPIDYFYSRKDGYYWPMCVCNVKSLSSQMDTIVREKNRLTQMKQNARSYALKELDFLKNCSSLHEYLSKVTFNDNYVAIGKKILERDSESFGVIKRIRILLIKIKHIFD